MNIETKKVDNNLTFKVLNDTCYCTKTKNEVIEILEEARLKRIRIRFEYGGEDGQSWGDIYGVRGYVGRSTGRAKIPIILYSVKSRGGSAILDHCIIKIVRLGDKKVLYQQANFKPATPLAKNELIK
jgi:hypothetical protein